MIEQDYQITIKDLQTAIMEREALISTLRKVEANNDLRIHELEATVHQQGLKIVELEGRLTTAEGNGNQFRDEAEEAGAEIDRLNGYHDQLDREYSAFRRMILLGE